MNVAIRPWRKGDLEALRKTTWQSWISTYSSFIPESDLKSYFDIHYAEASFLSMFNDPLTQVFVAERDDHIAGYVRLLLNREETRLYVPSLYLLPDFQGQDIGIRLLKTAEEYAAEKSLDELWIGVMVENRKALLFYRKVGFQFVREEPFTMGKTTVPHLIGYKKLGKNMFLDQKFYTPFDGGERLKSLPKLCCELLSEQKKEWSGLREGYALHKYVRERDIPCRGFSVRLQYNPGRVKSSLAVVAGKNQTERPCFLCLDHLPEGQKGISYRSDYLILCNPMPVFSPHFTISHLDHRLQAINEHIGTFLQLMADFGSGWTVLYNGPKCGASAPDHFHFQAAPMGQMPIEKEVQEEKKRALIKRTDRVLLYRLKDLGREAIVLQGDESMAVEDALRNFLKALKKVNSIDDEPMVNIAGFYEKGKEREGKWQLVIFPRRKHRPDAFFREGDARVVVSPGVIDMGGVLITPVEKDFERLDAAAIEGIYAEVTMDGKIVGRALEAMG
jgi:ribosomal protein S18 acetylase RimI-like enzyme